MASVDYHKCKAGTSAAGALLQHCDAQERLKHEHSNEHIDKDLTAANRQGERNYAQTMAAFRDRLAELDAMPGANRRRDRVELFMLEVPIPAGHDPERFAAMAVGEIRDMYGDRNVINWYLHKDEQHEYMDHGEVRRSLAHVHVPVVPEIDGRLNGKAFSSRARMVELNRRIDDGARELGGPAFLTGTHPRKRSVEELKIASYREAGEAEREATRRALVAEREAEEAETERQEAVEARKTALEATKAAEADQKTAEATLSAYEAVLERIRADGGLADRKHHKELGGREYVRVYADEIPALDAAAALRVPLLEAEREAKRLINHANREAARVVDEAKAGADRLLQAADISTEFHRRKAREDVELQKRALEAPEARWPVARSRDRVDRDDRDR